ncbi:MAG TPA: hypothetical protein VIX89_16055, partial [Bryobacteraceae bacterium]
MPGLPHHSQVFARIVVEHHGQMQLAFIILFDGFDERSLPSQREVEDIAPRARTQPDSIALL